MFAVVTVCGVLAACGNAVESIPTLASDVPASATGATLGATQVRQEQPSWCWLAVTQMALSAFGQGLSQCQIANEVFAKNTGNPDYAPAAAVDCCDPAQATTESACNIGGNVRWSADALGIDTAGLDRPLTEDEIQVTLTNGRPIGMGVDIMRGTRKKDHVKLLNSYAVAGGIATYEVLDSERDVPEYYTYEQLLEWHSVHLVTTWDKSYVLLRP